MSVSKTESDGTSRFNFILCIDLVVFACILIVAGRPDGVAITVSAIIVSVLALVYRCALGIRNRAAKARDKAGRQFGHRVAPKPAPTAAAMAKPKTGSWLRDAD